MSTLARLAWWGLQAIMWTALLGFILLLGLSRLTPYEVLIVRSGSMEPTLSTGGVVIVDRNALSPRVGTIASFRQLDGTMVTHRVVGMDGERYITRGDANRTNDTVTRPATAVYGGVVLALPIVGYIVHLLGHPVAFLILLLGTGGFLVVDQLRTIVVELDRMRRNRRLSDAN
jgi:signal peptidase